MVEILEKAGARCFVADYRIRTKTTPPPFQKYVYGSIESGYPAIISFETTRFPGSYHGIPIIGHTFNSDTWVPSAEQFYFQLGPTTRYVPSESWVSMYIGHDDNAGSHYCIPRHFFQTQHPESSKARKAKNTKKPARECVAHVISTVPFPVQVNPIQAEAVGVDYLLALRPQLEELENNVWAKRLSEFADSGRLVLRPILLTASQYASHLGQVSDWKRKRIRKDVITEIKKLRSEKLWMIELSVPEVFAANKRKLGEVIVRAEKKLGAKRDLDGLLLARVPGNFAVYESGNENSPKFAFLPSGAEEHVELFGCEETE